MTETGMWLYPLVMISVMTMIMQARLGIYWTWGLCLQQLIILGLSVAGLTIGPGLVFTALAWLAFFAFSIFPRRVLGALNTDLGRLYLDSARSRMRLVKAVFWGPPGQFWQDMTDLTCAYAGGDVATAEAVAAACRARKMPSKAGETLTDFVVMGKMLLRDWQGLVADYERWQREGHATTLMLFQAASRAYLELGRPEECVTCLEQSDFRSSRYTAGQLDAHFMAIFALAGALPALAEVLARLAVGDQMPEYARLFWQGRCLHIDARYDEARQAYLTSMEKLAPAAESWRSRIEVQLAQIENDRAAQLPSRAIAPALVARARTVLMRALQVARILHPNQPRRFTQFYICLLILAYGLRASAGEIWTGAGQNASTQILYYGILESHLVLVNHEWWRLLSYQFLHANINHLLVNVLAMWWFGGLVEAIYGPVKTAIICLGAGCLAGVAQIFIAPDTPALGASGAVMGVFGAAFAGMTMLKDILPAKIRHAELRWMAILALVQIIFDQIINNMPGSGEPGAIHVASIAHLGGMLAGCALGFLVRPSVDRSG